MKTKILYFDETAFNSRVHQIQSSQLHFENLLAEFFRLNVIQSIDMTGLSELISTGSTYLKNKLAEEIGDSHLTFGRFKLKRSAVIDNMIDLPNFEQLDQFAAQARNNLSDLHYYKFDGKSLKIDSSKMEALKGSFSIVGSNSKAIELSDNLDSVVNELNKLNASLHNLIGTGINANLFNWLLNVSPHDGRVNVNHQFYSRNAEIFTRK